MAQQARRGFMPTDTRDFGEKALPVLRKAAQEIYYLLNRDYPVTSTTRFIGDHCQLSERQRLALARTISPKQSVGSIVFRQAAGFPIDNADRSCVPTHGIFCGYKSHQI